jgi:hypothetical protein
MEMIEMGVRDQDVVNGGQITDREPRPTKPLEDE